MFKILATVSLVTLSAPAIAAEGGDFAPLFAPDSPKCIKIADIEKIAASFKPLKETTFRFVQALYAAIPPISHTLPPGDKAEIAIAKGGEVLAFLADGDKTCAILLAPPFIAVMLQQVEAGAVEHAGEGL